MVATIVSSLIYTNARRLTDMLPPALRKLWKEWELRVLVFLSLVLQIILIFFGKRRKYTNTRWLRVLLWCAYLMADWVATVALGVLSNNLGDAIENINGSLDANTELTAFWAPFLLLHLGGPDTITAYAMEDNELWLRHLLGLAVQTGVAIYIFIMAWTGSHLSILTIPMVFAGLIKYGERTWVLRSASNDQFRDSMLTSAEPGPNYPKFMHEYSLRQFEGYHVKAEEMIEVQVPLDVSHIGDSSIISDASQLVKAYELFKTFNRLFVDLILSFQDRENSQSLFKEMSYVDAFKVVEIELGFVFDVLYTKAAITYTVHGFILRLVSLSFTCIVLVIFCVAVADDDQKFLKIDLVLTFLLLVVAVFLEICAVSLLLSSDWTDLYLSKHANHSVRKAITWIQLPRPRWSNSMAQYGLLNVCLQTKPAACYRIQKLFCIDQILQKHRYKKFKSVSPDLKSYIFDYLIMKLSVPEREGHENSMETSRSSSRDLKGASLVLEKFGHPELKWSTDEVEFDQGILIWHIATYLCYCDDPEETSLTIMRNRIMSKRISKYMLYLLVMHPSMLPMGIGNIRYRDTRAEATKFFEERKSILSKGKPCSDISAKCGACLDCCRKREIIFEKKHACKMLLKVNTGVPPTKVKGDRSKSVLFDASKLASELQHISNKEKKWEMVCNVWMELLTYAASQCRGIYHAQQLRRGGELLTHVWLLMSHLGLTDQFQISRGHARAKLIME